jgi:hypothetical protein
MSRLSFIGMLLLAASSMAWPQAHTLAKGTEIKVRTDIAIPATPRVGARYAATVSDDVASEGGGVAIPSHSRATLVAERTGNGKDTALDLRSVTVGGKTYALVSAGSKTSGTGTLGANRRTAKYVGGGAVVGAVLGALLGGGKGAAIGALAGGAAGGGAQVLTGKKKGMPAETALTYKLAEPLTLRAVGSASTGLKKRPKG